MNRSSVIAIALCFAVGLVSCSSDDSVADVAPVPVPGVMASLALSGYAFDTDSISVVPGREKSPSDAVIIPIDVTVTGLVSVSGSTPKRAVCTIRAENNQREVAVTELNSAGAGRFTGRALMRISRGDVGEYRAVVTGSDSTGYATATALASIRVLYGGNPPELCGLTAPDTLDLPTGAPSILKLELCVSDRSGREDIRTVLFNSFLPSGFPSTGNPFIMVDDGTKGDRTAGDGVYSLDIQLQPTAQRGTYRFEFQAIDLGNLSSAVLIHRVVVR